MDAETVRQEHEGHLMQLPNVVGIGLGEKAGKTVIKVFVSQKVPASNLQDHEVVPKQIDGIETDVEELGVITAQAD